VCWAPQHKAKAAPLLSNWHTLGTHVPPPQLSLFAYQMPFSLLFFPPLSSSFQTGPIFSLSSTILSRLPRPFFCQPAGPFSLPIVPAENQLARQTLWRHPSCGPGCPPEQKWCAQWPGSSGPAICAASFSAPISLLPVQSSPMLQRGTVFVHTHTQLTNKHSSLASYKSATRSEEINESSSTHSPQAHFPCGSCACGQQLEIYSSQLLFPVAQLLTVSHSCQQILPAAPRGGLNWATLVHFWNKLICFSTSSLKSFPQRSVALQEACL